ncbi:unnamed protein product [Knipowitschia caucasica]
MESDASSNTGVFIPVPLDSEVFQNSILLPLQSAYLFEESSHSFRYTSAFLIKNAALENRYNACREKRVEQGYLDTELKETYGFLLFDELSKAKSIGDTGVLAENGTCTTLGDPTKGVYLSMYSDCLDQNCWYHGKSGYIVVVKITKGRVAKVSENYTQNLTVPTVGFDCHVSEQLQSVSSKTSSFLSFERTQYYIYELLDNGSTAPSPSLACPYAVVAFSYTDNKGTLATQQESCNNINFACLYSPWTGKLQVDALTFNIGIRSTAAVLPWAKLPPIINVEWVISMLIIRKLLPKDIFETTINGQGSIKFPLEHIYCSLCEVVALNLEEIDQLTSLLLEIKKQDVALIIPLSDRGFLILIHDSNFISNDKDTVIPTNKSLQGVFVFPESHIIQKDTNKMNQRFPADAMSILPMLIYAEGAIEKASHTSDKDLCDIIVQHMQSYATLMNPGRLRSPFREVEIVPNQFDLLDAHQRFYSTPEWTDSQRKSLQTYLSNANSFQLSVCKASEMLVDGQETSQDDLEDDIHISLSSPEASSSLISTEAEDKLNEKGSGLIETPQDTTQTISTDCSHKDVQPMETKEMPLRAEPTDELMISITSAAQTVNNESLDVKSDELLMTKRLREATLNSVDEIIQRKISLNSSDANFALTKSDKLPQRHTVECTSASQRTKTNKPVGLARVPTPELSLYEEMTKIQSELVVDQIISPKTQTCTEKTPSISRTDAFLKELETCALGKKTERWGLKPVTSTCGNILIPYGSVNIGKIRFLLNKLHPTEKNLDHPDKDILEATSQVGTIPISKQQKTDDKISAEAKKEQASSTGSLAIKVGHNKKAPMVQSKGQIMLRKLKSVILKKRQCDALKVDLNVDGVPDNELSPKRTKNACTGKSKVDDGTTASTEAEHETPHEKEAQQAFAPAKCTIKPLSDGVNDPALISVDPLFVRALGLTPKRAQGTLDENVHISDSSGAKEKSVDMEYSTCKLQSPATPSTPKGKRQKLLKKHRNVSADRVRKKWWLHFQTPTCYDETQSQCDISVRKTNVEKTNTSSEALNILADLALSRNKEQVPIHQAQKCEFEANTPFQVLPLNGISRLLQQLPHASSEDTLEQNRTPEDPKKSWYRRQFCQSRTIKNRDKTIDVTRHWPNEYNFDLDSRFAVENKNKTVVRALHGPWDSSIHDTNEEVQLIVHMWIGLFYSRSTARFFQFDPDITFPASEDIVLDELEVSTERDSLQSHSLNTADKPEAQVLDLRRPKNHQYISCDPKENSKKLSNVDITNDDFEGTRKEISKKTQVPEDLKTCPQELQSILPIQWFLNRMYPAGLAPHHKDIDIQLNGLSQLPIPVWKRITDPTVWTNNAHIPAVSGETHQTENTLESFLKRPQSPMSKCDHKRHKAGLHENESEEKIVNLKEKETDSNTCTDLYPSKENVDAMRSNHLLDIKKKYLEKLKLASCQINKNIDFSLPLHGRVDEKCVPLKKLLTEEIIVETNKLLVNTVGCQNAKIFPASNEKGLDHLSGFSRPTLAKDCTTLVNETTCSETPSGQNPFAVIGVVKRPSYLCDDSSSISSLQENKEVVPKDCQELSLRKQDNISENPRKVCNGLSCESPLINKIGSTYKHTNEAGSNVPASGLNAPFEGKIQNTGKSDLEDMELDGLDSFDTVAAPTSTFAENACYEEQSQYNDQVLTGVKVSISSDLGNIEPEDRCPTPTIDELPVGYTGQSNCNSGANHLDKLAQTNNEKESCKNITPVTEPAATALDYGTMNNVVTQSDIELRTVRTLECLNEYLSTLQQKSYQSHLKSEDASHPPIHDPSDFKTAFSIKDSCPPQLEKSESSQYSHVSPLNYGFVKTQQLNQKSSTSSPIVPTLAMPVEESSKPINPNPERPSKTVREQKQFVSLNNLKTDPNCDAQSKDFLRFSRKRTRWGSPVCNGLSFEAHHQNNNATDTILQKECKHLDDKKIQNVKHAESLPPSKHMNKSPGPLSSTVLNIVPYLLVTNNKTDEDLLNNPTSYVDAKTNTITDDSLGIKGSLTCTVSNDDKKSSSILEKVSKRCLQDNPTHASMDCECLIFFDQMKQLLKTKQAQETQCHESASASCPITVQFSHLQEQDDEIDYIEIPFSFLNQKISVDMSDKELMMDVKQQCSSKHQTHRALEQPGVLTVTAKCAQQYRDIMTKICSENRNETLLSVSQKNSDDSSAGNYFDFCSQLKKEVDDIFHSSLNSVVKKSCKCKNRFFLLATSDDAFFKKTHVFLESEGHVSVQPSDFFKREIRSSPLLIIVRNVDIAKHIFEVPHLLELRKSPHVQFAGIDEPEDVVNLTYQELFITGGFVMFDREAIESISSDNINKVWGILKTLCKTGKWKWVLHYRDSRCLKENARLCPKAREKEYLLNKCKEEGLLDILSYHECDLMTRQEPNYLQCLCHQQVQNISARYPVFVSDLKTDCRFEKNGIMTMTVDSFLMGLISKTTNRFV